MPELPEVETLKRELAKVLVGKKIKAIESEKFELDLAGQKILAVGRRAKILIFKLSGQKHLLIHLKMTGQLIYLPHPALPQGEGSTRVPLSPLGRGLGGGAIIGGHPQANPFNYTRATFDFSDGSRLYFNDLRKFGWLKLFDPAASAKIFAAHGPEPLSREFTPAKFEKILERYPNRKIKQLLLDQTLVAGLGNIYVDEACFLAKVLPTRIVKTLTKSERQKLHHSIIEVLKLSIAKKGTSARDYIRSTGERGGFVPYLNVYGRRGEPCKVCGTPITKIKLSGRGTHFCTKCQK